MHHSEPEGMFGDSGSRIRYFRLTCKRVLI